MSSDQICWRAIDGVWVIVNARAVMDGRPTATPDRYWNLREPSGNDDVLWFLKVVEDDREAWIDAYVGLDHARHVVERSSSYGTFEGRADWLAEAPDALTVAAEEFVAAWHSPKARLSWIRRLVQRLNGVDDGRDPTVDL